jgi:hypothetical protein
MKRSLIAVLAATFASVAFAASDQYRNNAGEQDLHSPVASNDQYRNEAGQQDQHSPQIG